MTRQEWPVLRSDANAQQCPLCGGPNGCETAAKGQWQADCWCRHVTVDRAALSRLPADQRMKTCLCQRCATGGGSHAG